MATYVVGDVQGCFTTLQRLLARIDFDRDRDRLWMTGDLVNRGPSSLEVLRWARGLGDRLVTVLGNHDLHLIARACGVREPRPRDTLDNVLEASDRDELLEWLVERPLFYREGDVAVVHAGIHPWWSLDDAERYAREVEDVLRSRKRGEFLELLYRRKNRLHWKPKLSRLERSRLSTEIFTRLRTCTASGELCLEFSGSPDQAPEGCRPWYELATLPETATICFGHWASLGLHLGGNAIGLDTGCVWGGMLTAVRLEDRAVFSEPSELRPGR